MVNKQDILQTLLYFDFFDYPLKKEEIYQFLKIKQEYKNFLQLLTKFKINQYKNYYYLKNRKEIVNTRIIRKKVSKKKLSKAIKIINKLNLIPFIYFIGVSGSLSMQNSDENDDIDVFVICRDKFIWTTRFLLILYLKLLRSYRKKGENYYKDKICVNLIIAKKSLGYFKSKKNIYLAHEIVQILPVFNKNKTYENLIAENKWVFDFLPNSKTRISEYKVDSRISNNLLERISVYIFTIIGFEKIVKFIQIQHMKKDITREVVSDDVLAFHPIDYQNQVLNKLSNINNM